MRGGSRHTNLPGTRTFSYCDLCFIFFLARPSGLKSSFECLSVFGAYFSLSKCECEINNIDEMKECEMYLSICLFLSSSLCLGTFCLCTSVHEQLHIITVKFIQIYLYMCVFDSVDVCRIVHAHIARNTVGTEHLCVAARALHRNRSIQKQTHTHTHREIRTRNGETTERKKKSISG